MFPSTASTEIFRLPGNKTYSLRRRHQGPVVRKSVSTTDPGSKVKRGFDFSCIKAYIRANVLWGFS